MKYLFLIFLFLSTGVSAQKTLSGVWTGALTNDSSQARNDQTFELALTEYRGKVYGYSYATFLEDDHLYYIVKRVQGTILDGVCEVTDDELVSTNLFTKLDKRVKRTITFRMNPVDSTWHIQGTWKTNKTREFYAITGTISLREEKDLNKSRVYEHLGDLGLQKSLAWDKKEEAVPQKTEMVFIKVEKPDPAKEKEAAREEARKEKEAKREEEAKAKALAKAEEEARKAELARAREEAKKQEALAKANEAAKKKEEEARAKELAKKKEEAVVKTAPPVADKKPEPPKVIPAAQVTVRKAEKPETISFKSDSLVLALYDNGEVDGDTVSVLLNGEIFLANQGLKSSAIKKTIYVPAGTDSLELVLYAENLGSYPPNTGLLIVYDGEDRYMVRFSADYNRNARVVLRRKK